MKSISEYEAENEAENAALVSAASKRRRAALRRLKQRFGNAFHGREMTWYRSAAYQIVEAWAKKDYR